jgi:hypothetical protein
MLLPSFGTANYAAHFRGLLKALSTASAKAAKTEGQTRGEIHAPRVGSTVIASVYIIVNYLVDNI